MSTVEFPDGLSAIADQYDAIFCDVWGVIHNGRRAFSDACDALVNFREAGGAVVLITNAPVPSSRVLNYFKPLGVPKGAFDDCVSSGDATRNELKKRKSSRFWLMGQDESWTDDQHLFADLGLNFTDSEDAETILCMGMDDQFNEHPEDYRERLRQAADRKLEMICANPDIKVRVGDNLIWCGGALGQVFESEGGKVIYPGKPYRAIYDLALEKLSRLRPDTRTSRILCIGDSPATDLRGARHMGLDSLYVGTGLTEHDGDFFEEVAELLASYQTQANWAMPSLRW